MADSPPLRVLIVDGCPDTRNCLRRLLGSWGHEVREAADGPAALMGANAFLPEVVLLDLAVPRMDGYEVARRLRRLPGLGRPLLVAVTGTDRGCDVTRAREAGFDLLLARPVDPEQLCRLLGPPPGPGRAFAAFRDL
ncbi:MAG TPA: response regulator [Gemmataceae bacterium]|nr:response regulator [Gemmataceae bacterium]